MIKPIDGLQGRSEVYLSARDFITAGCSKIIAVTEKKPHGMSQVFLRRNNEPGIVNLLAFKTSEEAYALAQRRATPGYEDSVDAIYVLELDDNAERHFANTQYSRASVFAFMAFMVEE
jgi:hypothetical protein